MGRPKKDDMRRFERRVTAEEEAMLTLVLGAMRWTPTEGSDLQGISDRLKSDFDFWQLQERLLQACCKLDDVRAADGRDHELIAWAELAEGIYAASKTSQQCKRSVRTNYSNPLNLNPPSTRSHN